MPRAIDPDPPYKRAMVVVAHADDAEYGCSGTVAKMIREGLEVVYVLCTDGSKGSDDPNETQESMSRMREQEQIAAGKVLGLKTVEFLGFPDSELEPTLALRKAIAREIRRHKPDIVICPNPTRSLDLGFYVGHPDHQAAGEAALSAVYPTARDRLTYPDLLDEGFEPHKVREVWVMLGPERGDFFNELSEEDMLKSIDALKSHASQVQYPEVDERMREWRSRTGAKASLRYAEAFKVFSLG
ncbi:MAG: PIG-L family deacetylase [Chloroflexi bacterium]|nr:PIG-L family deacetylase [Chloroflexota bacterium]